MANHGRNETNRFSAPAGVAITQRHLRVKLVAGVAQLAGNEGHHGTADEIKLQDDIDRGNNSLTIYSVNAPGNQVYVASGAIAQDAVVNTAVGGKVTSGVGAVALGTAVHAVAAADEVITVQPLAK